jgi:hypothetical protein
MFKMPILPNGFKFSDETSEKPQIVLPLLGSIENSPAKTPVNVLTTHFLNYLQGLKIDPKAPANLEGFLKYQRDKATQEHSTEWLTRTQSIQEQISQSGVSDEEILGDVSQALKKALSSSKGSLVSSFVHQECFDDLRQIAKHAAGLKRQLAPIAARIFLASFLEEHKSVGVELHRDKQRFVTKPEDGLARFRQLMNDSGQYAKMKGILDKKFHILIGRQLLSELCRIATIEDYLALPANAKTAISQESYDRILATFTSGKLSGTLQALVKQPAKFEPAIGLFRLALNYGTPLEKLAQIQLGLARLKDIYLFEEGEKPADEDRLMAIQFALIGARVENLVGIARYTLAFLKVDPDTEVLSRSETKHLGWFQKVVESIVRLVP